MNPGDIVDSYEIVRALGEGGMASVYLVRHIVLGSEHALKIMDPVLVAEDDARHRFRREGQIQAQLHHPNIVPVTGIVAQPGVAGLVMAYIDGPTLEAFMSERGALPADVVRQLFLPILAGVGEAHAHGIVHRDLKPANVLLTAGRDGTYRPLIADFGIAKLTEESTFHQDRRNRTRTQMRMGTLVYMAPEQLLSAGTVDRRADIFALGAILYEMATGHPAFDGETDFVVMKHIVDGDPADLPHLDVIDARIAACVRRALARKASERFPDCDVFATYLRGTSHSRPPSRSTRARTQAPTAIEAPLLPPQPKRSVTVDEPVRPRPTEPPPADAPDHDDIGPTFPDVMQLSPIDDPSPAPSRAKSRWLTAFAMVVLLTLGCLGVGAWQYRAVEMYYATHIAHTPAKLLSSVWTGPHGIRMRYVPSGRVAMGSLPSESGRDRDEVRYDVRISRPLLAMETEVTQAQWTAVMGSVPNATRTRFWDGEAGGRCDDGPSGPGHPVTCVDWYDAIALANALSAAERLTPAYTVTGTNVVVDLSAPGYRLPTEAEWQHMARAGDDRLYGAVSSESSLCSIGNVAGRATRAKDRAGLPPIPCDDGYEAIAPAGRFRANDYGLYDLVGNAWEWTWDVYTPTPEAGARLTDWTGPRSGPERVLKGGSWFNPATVLRTSNRYSQAPGGRSAVVGFRLVRTFRPADAGNGQRIR